GQLFKLVPRGIERLFGGVLKERDRLLLQPKAKTSGLFPNPGGEQRVLQRRTVDRDGETVQRLRQLEPFVQLGCDEDERGGLGRGLQVRQQAVRLRRRFASVKEVVIEPGDVSLSQHRSLDHGQRLIPEVIFFSCDHVHRSRTVFLQRGGEVLVSHKRARGEKWNSARL